MRDWHTGWSEGWAGILLNKKWNYKYFVNTSADIIYLKVWIELSGLQKLLQDDHSPGQAFILTFLRKQIIHAAIMKYPFYIIKVLNQTFEFQSQKAWDKILRSFKSIIEVKYEVLWRSSILWITGCLCPVWNGEAETQRPQENTGVWIKYWSLFYFI